MLGNDEGVIPSFAAEVPSATPDASGGSCQGGGRMMHRSWTRTYPRPRAIPGDEPDSRGPIVGDDALVLPNETLDP